LVREGYVRMHPTRSEMTYERWVGQLECGVCGGVGGCQGIRGALDALATLFTAANSEVDKEATTKNWYLLRDFYKGVGQNVS